MNKNYLVLSMLISMLTFSSHSQMYSGYGSTPNGDDYNEIVNSNDTLYFYFNSLPSGAYQNVTVTFEGSGYFDSDDYYDVYGPGQTLLGTVSNPILYNCNPFSSVLTIPTGTFNNYGGSMVLKLVQNGNIYQNCNHDQIRAHLSYKYCETGVPVEQAYFELTDNFMCRLDEPIQLSGLPAGGVFSGDGVSNNVFDPSTLTNGIYGITYTYTEANGCYTDTTIQMIVNHGRSDQSILTCEGLTSIMNTGSVSTVYASDLTLSNIIATGTEVTLPSIITSPTTFYTAPVSNSYHYEITALDATDFGIVDHNQYSGDDRSGVAVTANYVYVIGDQGTARFDLDLQNGVQLPIRDGMFTDLAQLKLYTLYNTETNSTPNYQVSNIFTMNSLRSLNEDLSFGDEIIMISQSITLGMESHVVILAGYNELVVGDAYNAHYHISIQNGLVTPLGEYELYIYESENWADWGMTGFDGTDRHAYFMSEAGYLVDFNFTTGDYTTLLDEYDFSDMSSIITHPVNKRLYGHYENGSYDFGGDSETLIYIQFSDSVSILPATSPAYGCMSNLTYTFNSLDLGADTTVCAEDGLYVIPGGFGYSSYTWNGVNNNYNSHPVQHSGEVILSVVDAANCTLTDSVVVTFTTCVAGINELEESAMQVYPVPNNGTFQITFNALAVESQIIILDAQGKQIQNKTVSQGTTNVGINLDVQPGIYFVRLVSESGSSQVAISIQ